MARKTNTGDDSYHHAIDISTLANPDRSHKNGLYEPP